MRQTGRDEAIRVLLIEDSTSDAQLIRHLLSVAPRVRFDVDWTPRFGEGLGRLEGSTYDVVLLDLSLPDAHRLDTVAKAVFHAPDVPIVVLTGFDHESTALEAVDAGAQDYLIKGRVDSDTLVRAIRYAIERQRVLVELRKLHASQTDFIANAAHELRTPLAVIAWTVELLTSKGPDGIDIETKEQSLELLQRQAGRVRALVGNLLDLSRLESGSLELVRQRLLVDEVVAEAVKSTPPPPGATVAQDVPAGLRVLAEAVRLEQVLTNLLANAYQYAGGAITVEASDKDDHVLLVVRDAGPGVSRDMVPQLFVPFARGPNAVDTEGSGLGLALVDKIVQALKGRIWYEPNKPRGARFCVTLPKESSGAAE